MYKPELEIPLIDETGRNGPFKRGLFDIFLPLA
jgi:hypothetical protein